MTVDSQPVRRRSALGVSGWLLFACLFLPTLRVCGDPMMPVQFPPVYGPYIGGLMIGFLGFAVLLRTRRGLFIGLSTLYLGSAFTALVVVIGETGGTVAGVLAAAVLFAVLFFAVKKIANVRWSERAISIGCIVHGMVALGWSSLLAFDPDGMWGAMVSLGAASLMLFASIGYAVSAAAEARRATEPVKLPTARVL
jgi:hypothetical protein